MTVKAIYENGLFRPVTPVNLPERAEVELHFATAEPSADHEGVAVVQTAANGRHHHGQEHSHGGDRRR